MNLVIVESPSKAKTIKKYLGKGYEVLASYGHVVDLPKSKMGIDVEKDFKPSYEVTNPKALKSLKAAYKGASELILAVDLDREGEAIAWHVAQKLDAVTINGNPKEGKKVKRIVFNEITKPAIEEAIKNPRSINMDLVNAQQARRFLDRLVGYKLSPVLWKKIAFGLSAGRVQSAALRLVVEREAERDAFKPEEYWSILVFADKKKANSVKIEINKKKEGEEEAEEKKEEKTSLVKFEVSKIKGKKIDVKEEKAAKSIIEVLEKADIKIDDVIKKDVKRYPKPPFTTSTLQQVAVNVLGYTSKKTMTVAQKLYEQGFITYMRTDSLFISTQAVSQARNTIKHLYGPEYLPESAVSYKTNSKSAQEAHEAIRPVDFTVEAGKSFTPEQTKLYDLIRKRALASQMKPAEIQQITAVSNVDDYELRATGSRIKFAGFLKTGLDKMNENILPDIEIGEIYHPHNIKANQHFTQPPARFSEATLIKKLEELGIGRPSTYSSIISTIISRKYVEKDSRYLFPTDTGKVVSKLLVKYFFDIVDYDFTSSMEDNLDKIAEGKLEWKKMLKDFYLPFDKEVDKSVEKIPRDEFTVLGDAPAEIKCPECGSKMLVKLGRFGKFYSCSKFPECKGILSTDGESKEDIEKEAKSEEFQKDYEPAPKTEDGRDYLLKKGKFGKFWAHPDYPKVKDAQPLVLKPAKQKELFGAAPKTDDGKDYVLRSGRFGHFWAHPDYPKVKDIKKIAKKEIRS